MKRNFNFDDVFPEFTAEFAEYENRLKNDEAKSGAIKQPYPITDERPSRQHSWSGIFRAMALSG